MLCERGTPKRAHKNIKHLPLDRSYITHHCHNNRTDIHNKKQYTAPNTHVRYNTPGNKEVSLCLVLKGLLCSESDENALHYSESLCAMRQW